MAKTRTSFEPGHEIGKDTRFGGPNANPGNPGGCPKGTVKIGVRMQGLLGKTKDEIEAILSDDKAEVGDKIAAMSLLRSMVGDDKHLRIALDRIDGPVTQKVDHTTDGEKINPVVFYLPDNGRDSDKTPAGTAGSVPDDER